MNKYDYNTSEAPICPYCYRQQPKENWLFAMSDAIDAGPHQCIYCGKEFRIQVTRMFKTKREIDE